MLSITLPPELEDALSRSARALGTTPECLALDSLRERFALQSGLMAQETTTSERTPLSAASDALPQTSSQEAAESEEQEQLRLHRLFESILVQAHDLDEQPMSSSEDRTVSAPEEAEYGAIITEKFRRQGFNL